MSVIPSTINRTNGRVRVQRRSFRDQLIEEHIQLVPSVVFQVANSFPSFVEREELVRAGALGLVEAAHRFDNARGVSFENFAARRIRGAILDFLRANDWAPRSVRRTARNVDATEQQLAAALGRRPTRKETADALGMTLAELGDHQERLHRSTVLALDSYSKDDGDSDLHLIEVLADEQVVQPPQELEGRELLAYLADAIELLPERLRLVIIGSFFENRSSAELAEFFDVSQPRISQMRSEAIKMLKAAISGQYGAESAHENTRSARKAEDYANAVAKASQWRDRIDLTSDASARVGALL